MQKLVVTIPGLGGTVECVGVFVFLRKKKLTIVNAPVVAGRRERSPAEAIGCGRGGRDECVCAFNFCGPKFNPPSITAAPSQVNAGALETLSY